MTEELLRRSAVELAGMVRDREVSPVELTEAALARIERLDPSLGSFATVDPDGALSAARDAEARAGHPDAPPLLGVPTAIKDLHLTEGLRTTFGTSSMRDFVPTFDEEHVARLRRAGLVFLGKTNVPEFGTVAYTDSDLLGPARNPWDLRRSSGGSSGGAAAAVAAGLVPVAQGSDGGGSIRIPASACGLFGLKPSRGRVSSAPLFGEQIGGLSTVGPLARHVVDAAALLDLTQGYVPGDPNWAPPPARPYVEEAGEDPPPLRVGLVLSTPQHAFDADTVRVTKDAARLLEGLGHEVEPATIPLPDELRADFRTLWTSRVAALPVDPSTLEPFNRHLHAVGAEHTAADLMRALTSVQFHSRALMRATLDFDVLLAPTLTGPPPLIGAEEGLAPEEEYRANEDLVGLTPVANLTGQPAMSLPLGTSGEGLPTGVQVLGGPAGEATLFQLAGQVQRAADWSDRLPDLD